jgi:hypothetical protein
MTQQNLGIGIGPCNVAVAWPAFPWLRFVYAEGDLSRVRIEFASYWVTVSGHGLAALLAVLANQQVVPLIRSTGKEGKFGVRGASQTKYADPSIDAITVEPLS